MSQAGAPREALLITLILKLSGDHNAHTEILMLAVCITRPHALPLKLLPETCPRLHSLRALKDKSGHRTVPLSACASPDAIADLQRYGAQCEGQSDAVSELWVTEAR